MNLIDHIITLIVWNWTNILLLMGSILVFTYIYFMKKLNCIKKINLFFNLFIAVILGKFIGELTTKTPLKFHDFSLSIPIIIFVIISLIYIREISIYKNTKKQITVIYFQSLFFFFLINLTVLVAINSNLKWIFLLTFVSIISFIIKEWEVTIPIVNNHSENSDNPIINYENLFPTRKNELKNIIRYLNNLDTTDPFAITINAQWGEGKTSFINVLQEKLKQDNNHNVIFIQPMILDTREKLLKYVFNQLEIILNNYSIYTGQGSPYKQYFDLLLKILNNQNLGNIFNLLNLNFDKKVPDLREYKMQLEQNINILLNTNKRIYIIIDDLDRVESDTIRETLAFIKEIVDLKGITVLFLIDYQKFLSDKITFTYMEKFVNEKFDLKKVSPMEMLEHYLLKLLSPSDSEFFKNEISNLQLHHIKYLNEIKLSIKAKINYLKQQLDQKELEEKDTSYLQEMLIQHEEEFIIFQNKLNNARYLKKVILNISQSIKHLESTLIEKEIQFNNLYFNFDIAELLLKLNIFKTLYREEYNKLYIAGGLKEYLSYEKRENYIVGTLFKEFNVNFVSDKEQLLIDAKINFCNSLIFQDKILDDFYIELKTEQEKIIESIDNTPDCKIIELKNSNYEKLAKYLKAINSSYYYTNESKNEARIKKFTNLVINEYNRDNIVLADLFKFFGDTSINTLITAPIFYNALINVFQNKPQFNNIEEKNSSIYYITDLESTLFIKYLNTFYNLLKLYNINAGNGDDMMFNSLRDSNSLEELNDVISYYLGKQKVISSDPVQLFSENSVFIYESILNDNVENFDVIKVLKHYNGKLSNFLSIIKNQRELKKLLENTPINFQTNFNNTNFDDIGVVHDNIKRLKKYLENNINITIDDSVYKNFHAILINIKDEMLRNREKIKLITLQELREIFNLLETNYIRLEQQIYLDDWNYVCLLLLLEIENNIHKS